MIDGVNEITIWGRVKRISSEKVLHFRIDDRRNVGMAKREGATCVEST
jgi:hypothetical protein